MPPLDIRFHPAATVELTAEVDWYSAHSPLAAKRFELAISAILEGIAAHPERGRELRPRVRRVVMRLFPYTVIYRLERDSLEIMAFAHASRRQGYWADRVREPHLAAELATPENREVADADFERQLAEGLKLTTEERAEMANLPYDSPEDFDEDEWAAAWAREIAHRLRELDAGRTKGISWPEARRIIRGE